MGTALAKVFWLVSPLLLSQGALCYHKTVQVWSHQEDIFSLTVDFLALLLLVSSTLPGDLLVFSDQIHPTDLQQEVRVPVVGGHPGLAAGPLLHGVHPSLDRLQALHHQRLPQRGEADALGSGLCCRGEVQPCKGFFFCVCRGLISKEPGINQLNEFIATVKLLVLLSSAWLQGCSKLAVASWCPYFIAFVSLQAPLGINSLGGEDKDGLQCLNSIWRLPLTAARSPAPRKPTTLPVLCLLHVLGNGL